MADRHEGGRRSSGSRERPRSLDRPRTGTAEEHASLIQESQAPAGSSQPFSFLPAIIETKTPPMSRAASISEEYRIAPMIQGATPRAAEVLNPLAEETRSVRSSSQEEPRVNQLHRAGTTPVPPRSAVSPAGVPSTARPRGRTESSRQPSLRSRPLSPRSQILRRQTSLNHRYDSQDLPLERRETGITHSRRQRQRADTAAQSFVSPGLSQRGTWATVSRNRGNSIRRRPTLLGSSGRDVDSQSVAGDFTLAGPTPVEVMAANQPYVDPGYAELNPAYDQPTNTRPVWGLARPLPRVIRPGMVPTRSELDLKTAEGDIDRVDHDGEHADLEQGRVEPTFRLDRISTQLQIARERREENLMRTYSRPHSLAPSTTIPSTPSGRLNPSVHAAIDEEDDPASVRLSSMQEGLAMDDPPLYPDDASAMDTEHDNQDLDDDEHWFEDFPLKPNDGIAEDEIHNLHTHWSVIRLRFREPLAELLAVTVQLTLGFCANLAVTTSNGSAGVAGQTCWAWGLASMVGIYIAGGISGAHLNPAISLMLYIYRGFPIRKMPCTSSLNCSVLSSPL